MPSTLTIHHGLQSSGTTVEPSLKPAASIRCYLDFDGTLSCQAGSKTVGSRLYRSLQTNPAEIYAEASFVSREEMVKKLTEGFKKEENRFMRLAPNAIRFLECMLENKAEIIVVSKNRREYIQAVLETEGLKKDDIGRMTIKDTNDLDFSAPKYHMVMDCEAERQKAKLVLTCDDDKDDCHLMTSALLRSGYQENMISHRMPTGAFKWDDIQREVTTRAGIAEKASITLGMLGAKQSESPVNVTTTTIDVDRNRNVKCSFDARP